MGNNPWAESQGSSIHGQSNAHCFMKCLDGELLETQYEWPTSVVGGEVNEETFMRTNDMSGAAMVETTKSYLKKNSVAYINGTFLNSTKKFFVLSGKPRI